MHKTVIETHLLPDKAARHKLSDAAVVNGSSMCEFTVFIKQQLPVGNSISMDSLLSHEATEEDI